MHAVLVKGLVKDYGSFRALNGISFEVQEGEVFGLIGPNGAGKTTTFRILAGLLQPTSGEVLVLGEKPGTLKVKRQIAYLPEDAGSYRNLTGYEFLRLVAELYYGRTREAEEAVELGIKISGLGEKIHEKMKTYSKGMKRRVQVARVLMLRPKLAIMDEPTAGLDVIQAKEIRDLIKENAKSFGVTILLSSHNMLEVEDVCSRVAMLNKGLIIEEGPVKELISKHGVRNLEEVFFKLAGGVT
ncbi:MAG: ABC transporter ATP-binding protein [Infirmifilum sp.]|jgi:ABC-2 type transport system ATP-binding protein|uniref:Multidrug ABC transporter ATP-binding protein n=1 Tax=Infirmifilum uzonense TaxID=1550241 RepID=A0A0F7FH93_9CREN|nr:ABC transporter ATP-binding protein [Infirmifilum uzonense]AKG38595.1 multidrug ABC transporter ATP-binding protein [Infirmifilum uzonense]